MEHDNLIAILTACSNRKGNRCSQCPAFGKGDWQCARNAMRAAAVAIKAQAAQLAAAELREMAMRDCIKNIESAVSGGKLAIWDGQQGAGEERGDD